MTENSSKIKRRSFLQSAASYTAFLPFFKPTTLFAYSTHTISGSLISASHSKGTESMKVSDRAKHNTKSVCLYHLNTMQHKIFETPMYTHSFVLNSKNKHILLIPKLAEIAGSLDPESGKLTSIEAKKGFMFYGHGVFSKDAQLIYCSEAKAVAYRENRNNLEGIITVRDSSTFKIVDEFPAYGTDPHDLWIIDDGKTLVSANGGSHSDISFMDIKTQKLIEKQVCPFPEIALRHLSFNKNGDYAVATKVRHTHASVSLPLPFIGKRAHKLEQVKRSSLEHKELKYQSLSLAIHDKTFATTCPHSNHFFIWDIASKQLIKKGALPKPSGVCLTANKDFYVVNSFSNNNIALINTKDFSITYSKLKGSNFLSGRHMANLSSPS